MNSDVYKKYATLKFTDISIATVEADLDAINTLSLENLPLLWYLSQLYNLVNSRGTYDEFLEWKDTYYLGVRYYQTLWEYGSPTTTHIHDKAYVQDLVAITLSGGAAANQELRAANATKKISLAWFCLHFDTAPGAAYFMDFHEASGATIVDASTYPQTTGQKQYTGLDCSTNNRALQCSFSGGGGTENLYILINTCTF